MHFPAFQRFFGFLSLLLLAVPSLAEEEKHGGPPEFKRIKYRSIGPAAGGRVSRAQGVAGDPLTYYAATAAGGVWKSSDGGHVWKPIFDDQPISSIGSLAVAPSDPSVIYVGSGEANIRGNVAAGNGIYKSEDAGKTWKHVWKQEGQIGTMAVHPRNAGIAYAAVLGHAFGPNEERGVYRTTDGGKTWKRVLHKDADTGTSDVVLDPSSPRVLFAGLWQARRRPWEMTSGGPGSGLYTSRDGGDTWTQLVPPPEPESPDFGKDAPAGKKYSKGLPSGIWGKVCLAIAPSDSRRIYALIEAEKGGLFRSNDGGDSWERVNEHRILRQRAWYFSTITVHPTNPDVVWFPQVPLLKSIDGGKTVRPVKGPHHVDHHDVWIDPKNPKRIVSSNDGGVDFSLDGGESWFAPPLPISQFYRIETDSSVPYRVMGSMQDIGTGSGPSRSLFSDGIALGDWETVGGGEAGHVVPDPTDPNVIYAGEYGGYISRFDRRTRQARNVGIYPYNPSGHGAEELKYRFQWTAPILVSKHDPKVIYHAANVLFRTTDGGQTWKAVSPDLTRNDKSKQKWTGGPITGDNTGVEIYCTIFALAESPLKKGVLWAGSDDGLVHVSRDNGENWTNVTKNIKGLPEWGTVCCIEPSPFDAGTAYVVVDNHRQDDMKPYLFVTTDYGETWKGLTTTLPADVYLHVVRADPKKQGVLYLGTERGVSFSTDGGTSWKALKLNLPTVAVNDLKVKDDDLVVGTNGRSMWILDDLTPIRLSAPLGEGEIARLYPTSPAVRYRYSYKLEDGFFGKPFANPPSGAILHYELKQKPGGEVKLEILDEQGKAVRCYSSKEEKDDKEPEKGAEFPPDERTKVEPLKVEPGLHRYVWNLRHEGAAEIKGAKVDSGRLKEGPLVLPGKYTARLMVDGKTYTSAIEVKLDPRQASADKKEAVESGMKAHEVLALQIRTDINRVVAAAEALRAVKRQLAEREKLFKDDAKASPLLESGKKLTATLDRLEEKLHNPKAQVSYDILAFKGGAKLYSQLAWLYEQLKDADGPPPQGIREVHEEQAKVLDALEKEWKGSVQEEIVRYNEQARGLGLPEVYVPGRPARPAP